MAFPSETLTIPSAGTASNVWDLEANSARRTILALIRSPATLPETVTVKWSEALAGTFAPLQSASGTDVQLTANEAFPLPHVPGGFLRLDCTPAAAADRVFICRGSSQP